MKRDIVSAGGSISRLADLWSYDLVGNVWTELSPGGAAPAARGYHVAALDAERGRLLLHGGWGGDQPVGEQERKRRDGKKGLRAHDTITRQGDMREHPPALPIMKASSAFA